MANESLQNVRFPSLADAPNLEHAFAEMLEDVVPRTNMRFSTTAARDAAIPSPVDGMECFTGSGTTGIKWVCENGAWRQVHKKSEWTSLAPGSGYTIQSGGWIKYKIVGDSVHLSIRDVTANSAGAGTMLTMPDTLFPAMELPIPFGTSTASAVSHPAWITTAGLVRATWTASTSYRAYFVYAIGA